MEKCITRQKTKTTECDESSIDNQSVAESQHPPIT